MIVDASLLRRAPFENIARLGRSLGVDVTGMKHDRAVSRVAKAVMQSTVAGWRERAAEERAQREEFRVMATIEEMIG